MPPMQPAAAATPATVIYAHLWWNSRWLHNARVTIDAQGQVRAVGEGTEGAASNDNVVPGITVPGMSNAHCHAFQRLLGAITQRSSGGQDNFWSWRETMYALAARLDCEALTAITARCYLELLRGGYTSVAEFLYLHRLDAARPDSARHGELNADSAVADAAALSGLQLTLLPTLYQHADFGGVPARPGQQPFVRSTAQFLRDWQELRRRFPIGGSVALGVAFHSLRAVDLAAVDTVMAEVHEDAHCRCIHIHVAEQVAEVAACVRLHGMPPVALLASRGLLSPRWSLVHATHADNKELEQVRVAGATVVLCPTTEADLGDGIMNLPDFLTAGGHIAIGSDSNVGRNACAELRLLEWTMRLAHRQRNVLSSAEQPAVAERIYAAAWRGGQRAQGIGQNDGAAGQRADFVTYDLNDGDCLLQQPRDFLSALVFDSPAPCAQQVMVGGKWVIRDGRHENETEIEMRYCRAVQRLLKPGVLT
jgi:formimidoylglutamate deiminase